MLGQKLETTLKSQTLPRLDGQDEEGEALDNQFEILSIANSCPDLTVLEIDDATLDEINQNLPSLNGVHVLAGYKKSSTPPINSGSFWRSTSLSSLGADCVDGAHHENNNGPIVNALKPGRVSKVVGQLEKGLKKEIPHQLVSTDFIRTALRASHGGATGHLHKSVSTPSVTQYFVGGVLQENYQKSHNHRVQSDAHQHNTKRSFFRRKHKSKSNLMNSPVASRSTNKMDGGPEKYMNGSISHSLIFSALYDPSLGLQDPDAECWTLSMDQQVVNRLEDKEVKRQEHMYELIMTEKHHCLTLALMQHLFINDMKKYGFARYARLMFPELNKLVEVHFSFLRRMRERQAKFRELGQPMDTLTDILLEQFTSDQYHLMARLYGLLCASHHKSLDLFRSLMKDPKFASLVASWDKETLLGRKNVRECLLLVAQRITKYPLLIEPILKTSLMATEQEKDQLRKSLQSSKDLNKEVNQRVEQRQQLVSICEKIDSKSFVMVGQKRRTREDIVSLPSRRLLFVGTAFVNFTGVPLNKNVPCAVIIMTDCLVFTQEISLKYHFVSPPGIVMLNNLIVRENAGLTSSLFLVLGTGTSKPEMIDLQVTQPPQREHWMGVLRKAIEKCLDETETGSDVDEEVDSADLSDLKTSKALEELQEQDKQMLAALRSRSRIIEGLRTERPNPGSWIPGNFEGKDTLLHSLSSTCSEVQRIINLWEANANSSVNRSSSCVGEHIGQGALLGLPKRADTFGGFDSQQRSALELPQCTNNKLLMEMVIQLSQLCGEMFSQMIPQLLPNVYQTHHQLQRRMEDLREAQQRLETEKSVFQQELSLQKESIDRERAELSNLKHSLQKEQEDITQQREQLYRKLEALQRQGIRPPLDPISPVSVAVVEKPPTNPNISRRPPQTIIAPTTSSSVPVNNQSTNGVKSKQQLPLFLASNSSFKAGKISADGGPPPIVRNTAMSSFKLNTGMLQNASQYPTDTARQQQQQQPAKSSLSKPATTQQQQVQQLLPLRLSEGNSNKTASLPRGVGSRSVSSMLNQIDQTTQLSPNHQLRPSASSSVFPNYSSSSGDGSNGAPIQSNSSFLYGPAQNQRKNATGGSNDEYSLSPDSISIVHRRSGSSPVPMSTVQTRRPPAPEIHYHQHPFFKPRDDDGEKILFL